MEKGNFCKTPPMGWNSYDYYDTTVTEDEVKANADFMAANLKQHGYEYVIVDIEWFSRDAGTQREEYQYIPFGDDEIDEYGRFIPATNRFPSAAGGAGFKPLADYVHGLGLKFGIHIMRGIPRDAAHRRLPILGTEFTADMAADAWSVCGWNPDMYGVKDNEAGRAYYKSIIQMYADWGVDYIKCDDICDSFLDRSDRFSGWHETEMLHEAIEATGRDIVLSLSPGPAHIDRADFYCENANMWRITDDFWDDWKLLLNMFDRCKQWQDVVNTGCYPDCDMIPIGKVGRGFKSERTSNFTMDECKTMMSLWCMFRSPLMLGGELTMLTDEELSLITNDRLLALLSDDRRGHLKEENEKFVIWENKSQNPDDDDYIAIFNISEEPILADIELGQCCDATEIWENVTIENTNKLSVSLPIHSVKVYVLKSKK